MKSSCGSRAASSSELGASIIEYVIIIALIALLSLGATSGLGSNMDNSFACAGGSLSSMSTDETGPQGWIFGNPAPLTPPGEGSPCSIPLAALPIVVVP